MLTVSTLPSLNFKFYSFFLLYSTVRVYYHSFVLKATQAKGKLRFELIKKGMDHHHHHDQKQKHLRELLTEDQEPFLLHKHIANKRCHLKTTSLQPKKHNLFIDQTSLSTSKHVSFLCRQACFLSFTDSPDFKKTPFTSPAKSPCKAGASRFLHIPAKTAAMLLEAAIKIQSTKPKTQAQNIGFGLFGSLFKRLRNKNKAKKRELCVNDASTTIVQENVVKKMEEICEDTRRVSSAGWSESNEGKSLDLESCSTASRSDCSSPATSPFHVALQRTLTPDISSPVASPIPICHSKKVRVSSSITMLFLLIMHVYYIIIRFTIRLACFYYMMIMYKQIFGVD